MIGSPLVAFIRASSLHIGAAAAAASLRHDLVRDYGVEPHEIDTAYAVSRVTPGTNLLALYALLGHRLGGWRLAILAVTVGALVPALIAVVIALFYTEYSTPLIVAFMKGARAGGVAVFLGAAVRLLKPQVTAQTCVMKPLAIALAAFLVAWFSPVSLFVVLLLAGLAGALWLRPAA